MVFTSDIGCNQTTHPTDTMKKILKKNDNDLWDIIPRKFKSGFKKKQQFKNTPQASETKSKKMVF